LLPFAPRLRRGSAPAITPQSREFLTAVFGEQRCDLIDGTVSEEPCSAGRTIPILDALLAGLRDEREMSGDDRVRSYVEELAKATDEENEYERAVCEHRAFEELGRALDRRR
jgi:hypothetical protein